MMAEEQPTYASRLYCSSNDSNSELSLEALLSASARRLDSSCPANGCFSVHMGPKDASVSKMLDLQKKAVKREQEHCNGASTPESDQVSPE